MWTAPCLQDDVVGFRDRIVCVHMSGLLARSHMNAGQDGFRDVRPKQRCDLDQPLASAGSLTSWIDRSRHLFVLLQGPASAWHGCGPAVFRARTDSYKALAAPVDAGFTA